MRHELSIVLLTSLIPVALVAQKPPDLSKLDACKILTPADVSAATKRKVIKSVGGEVHCLYVMDAPQSVADAYDFYLEEAAVTDALLRVKSAAERGTPVPGLWSEAYVGPAIGTKGLLSLTAVNSGDMAIEIHGTSKDALIELAKVAVSRLK
jgi:hypothetical protein